MIKNQENTGLGDFSIIWKEALQSEDLILKMQYILKVLGFDYDTIQLLERPVPQKFYKYTTINQWLAPLITQKYASFAKPKIFNDELDAIFPYNSEDDKVVLAFPDEIKKQNDSFWDVPDPQLINQMYHWRLVTTLRENVYVYSITSRPDSLNLWGWYSNNTGVVLGYDSSAFFTDNIKIFPMIYHENKTLNLQNFLADDNLTGAALVLSTLLKSSEWKAEDEWRMLEINTAFKSTSADRLEVPLNSNPSEVLLGNRFGHYWLEAGKDKENPNIINGLSPFMKAIKAENIPIYRVQPVYLTQSIEVSRKQAVTPDGILSFDMYKYDEEHLTTVRFRP